MTLLEFVLLVAVVVLAVSVSRLHARTQRVEVQLEVLSAEQRRRRGGVTPVCDPVQGPMGAPDPTPTWATSNAGVGDAGPLPGPDAGPRPAGPSQGPPPLPPVLPALPRSATSDPVAAAGSPGPSPASGPASVPVPGSGAAWPKLPEINWEQFVGVKLFAWLGGLALFLAAAFFLKYSFDHDLIPPALRVAMGYVLSIGLVLGGLRLRRRDFDTLSSTLVGTGVVILYTVTFACRAHYQFPMFGVVPTFLLMVLITVAAFVLAVRMDARVVAVLGLLGGFLTPVLIQTGQDNPVGLFSYATILNLGLFAVVANRRWTPIVLLAAVATVVLQMGWMGRFYAVDRLVVLQVVQPLCVLLFAGFHVVMQGRGHGDRWVAAAFVVPAAFVLLHGLGMAGSGAGEHPVRLFQIWLMVDALVLAAVLKAGGPRWVEPAAASGVFLLLSIWTTQRAGPESLLAAFAAYFLFAVLHTAVPVVRLRLRPDEKPGLVSQLFPAMALGLFLLPLMSGSVELPGMFWVAVLAVVVLALGFAAWVGAFLAAGAVLLVATGVVIAAFVRGGLVGMDFGESLLVVAGFAAVFVAGGWWLSRGRCPAGWGVPAQLLPSGLEFADNPRLAISGAGAVLPFLLLAMLVARAGEEQLHPLFAMTGVLGVVVLGLVRATRSDLLGAFGLLGCALVQFMWWSRGYAAMRPWPTVAWALGFYAAFTAFPFLVDRVPRGRPILWITAACAAPLHFLLIHLTLRAGDPLAVPGLVPAAFAVPSLGILAWLARRWPVEQPHRLGVLSVQGGVALLFITLVFPIQFSREWLTVAWGLEGAALVWLFRRLPHPGLRLAGLALLAVAFVRLTLNPAVLEYHVRTGTRIWNWYLFAYLVVAGSQFVAARLIRPPADQLGGWDVRTVLRAFGAILLFALLNLEIADYFAGEGTLTFEFTGNFARDLSYTIGWGLFALGLVVAGILHASRGTRYAGLGLLAVTLAKLFFHDLARLDQLYRIGAFAGVAVIAIVASFLYQRFLNRSSPSHDHPAP